MFETPGKEALYQARLRRYLCAMQGGTPDRIPIRFLLQEAAAGIAGYTTQEVSCDWDLAFEATRLAGEKLGCDAVMLNAIWSTYQVGKAASWKYLHVPGVDVSLSSVLQFSEPQREEDAFLREEEYEEFIQDPTAFLVNKWFSRAASRVRPAGAPVDFDHNVALMSGALAYANYMHAFGPAAERLKYDSALVSANAGMIKAPFDILCDKFRGFIGTAVDSLERPETLRRACEALMPHVAFSALAGADPLHQVPVTIWAHRGCVPFVSPETFDSIVWPTLKPVFEEIISKGHQILFYGEGNWEAHYDALRELPAGSLIYHLDKGSPALAARKLKDRFALSGGLSYDVLARGTPEDVRRHMKELFAVMKPGGGYILDATALMLSDIKEENLRAAVDYTLEYGVYSQSSPAPLRGSAPAQAIPQGQRVPGTVRPWAEESSGYRHLSGDRALVQAQWEKADAALYNYLWTTVLW
ncbi:MAG: uroporphyrinogen decarboxylase family protein [Christensenellales bacterium]